MPKDFNPLNHFILFSSPRRMTPYSAWHEHIPFAMLLVELLKPKVIVELGTHYGDSYCAFCQAVQELQLSTRCYAIDTWQGDPHVGVYGSEVLADLRAHHDPLYGSFSRLIQSTFDDALRHFSDAVIDLLHIDGYHTYEIVKHDFESWLPRISTQGVVLFHDVNVREGDFGVWKFWEEVRQQFPHFEFVHGHGLGVLAVGREIPEALKVFLQCSTQDASTIRHYFFHLGARLSMRSEHVALLRAEQKRSEQDAAKLQAVIHDQQRSLQEKDRQVVDLTADRDRLAQEIVQIQATLQCQLASQGASLNQQLASLNADLAEQTAEREKLAVDISQLRENIQSGEDALAEKDQQIAQLQSIAGARDQTLSEIENSLAWILITQYRGLRNKFLPDGSRRRRTYNLSKKAVKIFIQEGGRRVLTKTLRKLRKRSGLALIQEYPASYSRMHVSFTKEDSELQSVPRPKNAYEAWLRVNAWTDKSEAYLRERLLHAQDHLPMISVVVPLFDSSIGFLEETLDGVRNQIYDNWELCIADNGSQDEAVREILEKWVVLDHRIKIALQSEKGAISRVTNAAAELAEGEFLLLLGHNDLLSPDAIAEVALYLIENADTDFLYSDEDGIDESGTRFSPQFKPDWSPELLLSYMYCGRLLVVRRRLYQRLGGMREGYEGAEDYDLTLRATEQARRVGHIPIVLYHGRTRSRTAVTPIGPKTLSSDAARRVLQETLDRRKSGGTVYRPDWAVQAGIAVFGQDFPDTGPTVAVIVATKDRPNILRRCLSSVESATYNNYQVVVVDDGSEDPTALAYFQSIPHRVVRMTNPNGCFTFASIMNRAVDQVDTDYVLFLDSHTEFPERRWLSRMVGYAQFAKVGVVGPRLLFPGGRIQHCGIIHGLHHGMVGQPFALLDVGDSENLLYTRIARNYSAVSGVCMLTPRRLFLDAGGFDEENFESVFTDVDYCNRLVTKGYRCVYCPTAEALYYPEESNGLANCSEEGAAFKKKYRNYEDPWINPNLSFSADKIQIEPRKQVRSSIRTLRAIMCSHNLNWEGAPQSQYELAIALKISGVIEPVIYSPEDGPLRSAYQNHGIEVFVRNHPLFGVHSITDFDHAILKFAEFFTDLNVELVYANTLQTFYAIAAAERVGLPSLWNPRESEPWQTYFDFLPSEIRNRALECFRYPYRVIFVSDTTRIGWEPLNFAHNFTVIHNGLDIQRLKNRCANWTREGARRTLQLQDQETAIVLLGTVCARKGQQDLPLALRKVPAHLTEKLRCYIVGDRESEYSDELKRLISDLPQGIADRICIVAETHDVGLYYFAADVFLCTSRLESYPRVILEAMAFGLPIITTDVFGIKEQVVDNVNALFYAPGDTESLAAALIRILSDNQVRTSFAANSLKVLRTLNTFEEMAAGYAELFREAYLSKGYPIGKPYRQPIAGSGPVKRGPDTQAQVPSDPSCAPS